MVACDRPVAGDSLAWVVSQPGRTASPRLGYWTEMTRQPSYTLAVPFIIIVCFGKVNQRSFRQIGLQHLTTAMGLGVPL